MTGELYLIQHKVRGEPAFDVAQKVMIGKEEGWIIPTSGHRAYPYWWRALRDLMLIIEPTDFNITELARRIPLPDDWPDHYDAKRDDGAHLVNAAREILLRKGRIRADKPAQPQYRRA